MLYINLCGEILSAYRVLCAKWFAIGGTKLQTKNNVLVVRKESRRSSYDRCFFTVLIRHKLLYCAWKRKWTRTAVILLWESIIGSISHAEESAHIEGYLALTLYIIEQVIHDGKKNHILVSMSILGYLLRDKGVARTFPELVVHQAGITINTLDRRAQRFGHASGSSAPSMMFPTPSMTLYVGICFPSAETELKKWGLGVRGDCEVGSKPWPCGKERGAVVHKPLRNVRESANEEMARIIWSEMKQSWAGRAQVPQQGTIRSSRPGVIEVYLKWNVICISIRDLCLLCCCCSRLL